MQATYDLCVALECERPNFYSAMAYPGSKLHQWAASTAEVLRNQGATGLDKIAKTNAEVAAFNKTAKSSEQRDSPYLSIPANFDVYRPLLPEERDRGAPGWIGYTQH